MEFLHLKHKKGVARHNADDVQANENELQAKTRKTQEALVHWQRAHIFITSQRILSIHVFAYFYIVSYYFCTLHFGFYINLTIF